MALIHTAEAGYLSSTEIGKLTSLNSLNRGTLTSLVMGNVAVADFFCGRGGLCGRRGHGGRRGRSAVRPRML